MINEAAQYRKSVKALLQCDHKAKERLLSDFDRLLSTYLDEYPDSTMDELIAAFGPPEAVASELMRQLTPQEVNQHRNSRLTLRILALVVAVFLSLATIYIWFFKEVGLTTTNEMDIVERNEVSTLEPTSDSWDEPSP